MKLINQSSEIWGQCPTEMNASILWIEKAGRVCYRSEDKIVHGSGIKFVDNIIKRGHLSVIEHSNFVLREIEKSKDPLKNLMECRATINNNYIDSFVMGDRVYSGGNIRAWMEQTGVQSIEQLFSGIPEGLELVTDHKKIPDPLKRFTVEFITDRAVTHELVRHRPCSFSQESQRYCAYGDIKFIYPSWYTHKPENGESMVDAHFKYTMQQCENSYNQLRKSGLSPQDARVVLPNQTATKIVITASLPEWEHIFNLRCSKAAYTQVRNLMDPVRKNLVIHY